MNKSWITKQRNSKEYLDIVQNFIKFGIERSGINEKILYLCRKCVNSSSLHLNIVEEHLVWNSFLRGYTQWVFHGESMLPSTCNQTSNTEHVLDFESSNL